MEEKLIVAVCEHPELYDTASYWYRDQTKKDSAWRRVSEDVGVPEDVCRREWKGLRDTYIKERKKNQEKWRGSAAGTPKRWKYSVVMSFLDPFITPRETSSNMVRGVEEERTTEYGQPSETGGKRAKKRPSEGPSEMDLVIMEALKRPPPTPLPPPPPPPPMSQDELFFKSLLPAMERVAPEKRDYVRLHIYKIIVENQEGTLNLEPWS